MSTQVSQTLISVDEARDAILRRIWELEPEMAGVINALGKTLAEDICAESDVPPVDISLVDGYALIATETQDAAEMNQKRFSVLCEITAGGTTNKEVIESTAVGLHSGTPVPRGANAVVMSKHCYREDADLYVMREVKPGENIKPRGEESRKGDVIISRGTVIGPSELAVLAALGKPGVTVTRKPRASVVTVGDEVVDIAEELPLGKVRNSTRYQIVGQILSAGCELGPLIHIRNNGDSFASGMSKALRSDVIIIATSAAESNYKLILEQLAATGKVYFSRVAITPGKPFAFAIVEGRLVFVLSSDPVSSTVSFEVMVRPALMKLLGRTNIDRPVVSAIVTNDIRQSFCQRRFVRARTTWEGGFYTARPVDLEDTGKLKTLTQHNSLIIIREDRGDLRRGDTAEVMMLE